MKTQELTQQELTSLVNKLNQTKPFTLEKDAEGDWEIKCLGHQVLSSAEAGQLVLVPKVQEGLVLLL
jgi:hypothetical protein